MNYFFSKLYHSYAFSYEFIALLVSSGEWFKWVKQTLKYVNEQDIILEIGFGTGVLYQEITKLGQTIFGIDESQNMINITRKKLDNNHLVQQLTRGNAKNLPFPNESFNLIISTFPSAYVFDQIFLDEIERVLTKKGLFVALLGVKFSNSTPIDFFNKFLYKISKQSINIESVENYFINPKLKEKFDIEIETVICNKRHLYFLKIRKL